MGNEKENLTQGHVSRQRARVLLVEDSEFNRKLLEDYFSSIYTFKSLSQGKGFFEEVKTFKPDLILMDIVLPDADGFDLIEELKEVKGQRDIPVIFITSKTSVENEDRGLALGAVDYITKPYFLPVLARRLRTHIELKKRGELLEKLASIDPLTSLQNRRRFEEVFDTEWRRARRDKASLALLIADIDHFKSYNDQYGHNFGDEVLIRVAMSLSEQLNRPADSISRWGGEEFAILLPDTDESGLAIVAEKMHTAVKSMEIDNKGTGNSNKLSISLGGSCCSPFVEKNPLEFFTYTDELLYEAKNNGRNHWVVREMN